MNNFAEQIYFMQQKQAEVNRDLAHKWQIDDLLRAKKADSSRRLSQAQRWLRLLFVALSFKV